MILERAISVARDVRADLLRRTNIRRDLAGQCGLASMRVASMLQSPEALRVGFYMRHEMLCGHYGRYPNDHAWCRVGDTIVDPTATQFGRHRAVHVVRAADTDRYIETARGTGAIDTILIDWRRAAIPEYKHLAQQLRMMPARRV